MFKEQMNKLKSLIAKNTNDEGGKTNKRKIENLVFFLIILIVTLIAINTILRRRQKRHQKRRRKSIQSPCRNRCRHQK